MKSTTNEISHFYGPRVHILSNLFLEGLLARLCRQDVYQPEINSLVEILYNHLLIQVMNAEFEKENFKLKTRMSSTHPDQFLYGQKLLSSQKAVVVNLARAGTYPAHVCFNTLHYAIEHSELRQDHIFAARSTNYKEEVVGANLESSKIGGSVDNAIVLFPDPMGATGNTIISALNHYRTKVSGIAKKYLALHLIVTPEYLKKVLNSNSDVIIYTLRLDRGLSSSEILKTPFGNFWDQEKGLNEKQYIVPGAGGFGEIMNNSFV